MEQMALPNLKRSGFVPNLSNAFIFHWQTKQSAAVFLMSEGL